MQDIQLEQLVKKVLEEMNVKPASGSNVNAAQSVSVNNSSAIDNSDLEDLGDMDFKKEMQVPNPHNKEALMRMKPSSPGRIAIWRAGPRYTTRAMLRFRADHATAQDAVFDSVPLDFIESNGWFEVQSQCESKDVFITRPDLGRLLNDDGRKIVSERCTKSPTVQIFVADGLSSTAVMTNAKTTYQAIEHGLKNYGINIGTPFFVKYGRVGCMDDIGVLLKAQVVVVLIGERPGLITSESMSAYIVYNPAIGMPESKRTVVSNIHAGGMPAVEAGAYIADIVKKILEQKASGLDLK